MGRQKKKISRNKILVCRDLDSSNSKDLYYFRCSGDNVLYFEPKQYVYKITTENMKNIISVFRIVDVVEESKCNSHNIVDLKPNERFHLISYQAEISFEKNFFQDAIRFTFIEFQKEIKRIFRKLQWDLRIVKREEIDEKRKEYLYDTFGMDSISDFQKKDPEYSLKWLNEFNPYDYDFQFIIMLYELKPQLLDLIDKNEIICNVDKVTLKAKCIDKIEHLAQSTVSRERARTQMDSYMGVDFCEETKELVWGHMSPCEIKIEFCFFWKLVKSMLSLAYIPIVILLLQDKNTKISMYIFLALVYLIAIIFSDEKQVEKILEWRNSFGKEKVTYGDLYYLGLVLSTTFIVFSIQLVQGLIVNMTNIIFYLFADIMLSYVIIVIFNLGITMVAWGGTFLESTKIVREKGNSIWEGIKKALRTIFWVCSLVCCFILLDVQKYFSTKVNSGSGVELFLFIFCVMIVERKLYMIWKKEEMII